jgi:hypothetical protein
MNSDMFVYNTNEDVLGYSALSIQALLHIQFAISTKHHVIKCDLHKRYNSISDVTRIRFKVVSSNPVHGEVYSIQHYVLKFVSDLRQVSGFLRVHQFPPPIKLTATI